MTHVHIINILLPLFFDYRIYSRISRSAYKSNCKFGVYFLSKIGGPPISRMVKKSSDFSKKILNNLIKIGPQKNIFHFNYIKEDYSGYFSNLINKATLFINILLDSFGRSPPPAPLSSPLKIY
jgi:hypothetical protein